MREFEQKKITHQSPSPFFGPKIQKKLTTGTVGDKYETEADNVADKVVNSRKTGGLLQSRSEEVVQQKPISETISTVQKQDLAQEQPLQKKGKEKEEDKKVQKKGEKEEDKKVQKKSDKEEDKKVQKKGEKEEDKKVQKKSDKEEDKKVQKKGEKEEDKKVQKKSDKEEDKKVQKKAEKEEDKKVQKKCADCEGEDKKTQKKEEKKTVQTKLNEANSVDEGVESNLNSSKGSGNSMDKNTKQEMESGFGADFSSVNIHTDSKAVQMSEQLGAQAFTHGNDVYFNKGKYNPNSKEGKHLLAHELTHTIQQTGSKTSNKVQKKDMLQLSAIPWNISQWTTHKRTSNNFSVGSGGSIAVSSNLAWVGPPRCSDIASTIEIKIYRSVDNWFDSNVHNDTISLSGGSTSISDLSSGTYYVEIYLEGYNGDPTHCSLTGNLSINAT